MKKFFTIYILNISFIFINIYAGSVCLDPGHGGTDGSGGYFLGTPGLNGNTEPDERHVVLEIALETEWAIANYYTTETSFITRVDDIRVEYADRVAIAEGTLPDANGFYAPSGGVDEFLSIHNDGNTNQNFHGTSCHIYDSNATSNWVWNPPSGTARYKFADRLLLEYFIYTIIEYSNAQIAPYNSSGYNGIIGRGDIYVIKFTSMPAVVIECEFLTSNDAWYPLTDWYFYGDWDYIYAAADGLAAGSYYFSPIINSLEQEKPVQEISGFRLQNNYPNPFNPTTTIKYHIKKASDVELEIFNSAGQLIKTLTKDHKFSGFYSTVWDGTNNNGLSVASGTYICRLRAGEYNKSIKLALIR